MTYTSRHSSPLPMHHSSMSTELSDILLKHDLSYAAWRFEQGGILTKADLPTMWAKDQDFFGSESYSRNTFKNIKTVLREYAPSEYVADAIY